MKLTTKIAAGVFALALFGGALVGCSNSSDGFSLADLEKLKGNGNNPSGNNEATIQYTTVWEGTKVIDWDNPLSIDHANFTAEFDAVRVTYNATAGAVKLAVSDIWTDITLTDASISDGSIAADGAFNLPTGDNQTVTIKLSAADVAGIKGDGGVTGWGGLSFIGANTITITKVESFKAASTQSGGGQAQTPAYTTVWEGTKVIDWDNPLSIDHANFTAEFDAVRVTYNATAGAVKLAVSDIWTDITLTDASISDGSIAADGAFNLPTGDNQTVTIKLSAADVAGIKGDGGVTGWGGLSFVGANTITITKVESFKQ